MSTSSAAALRLPLRDGVDDRAALAGGGLLVPEVGVADVEEEVVGIAVGVFLALRLFPVGRRGGAAVGLVLVPFLAGEVLGVAMGAHPVEEGVGGGPGGAVGVPPPPCTAWGGGGGGGGVSMTTSEASGRSVSRPERVAVAFGSTLWELMLGSSAMIESAFGFTGPSGFRASGRGGRVTSPFWTRAVTGARAAMGFARKRVVWGAFGENTV